MVLSSARELSFNAALNGTEPVRLPSPWTALMLASALVLAGCASTPGKSPPTVRPGAAPAHERDGLESRPPDVSKVPNAEPRIEPIRPGGANKPYEVLGRDYTPLREDRPLAERGIASWYGKKFHGRRTASGEVYNMYAMTAAHKTMPIPSYARVRNPKNGREIIVRVNDRGPFHAGRVIDLSYAAAVKLGVQNGVAPVEVERITHEEIRTGSWRRSGSGGEPVSPEFPLPAAPPVLAAVSPSLDGSMPAAESPSSREASKEASRQAAREFAAREQGRGTAADAAPERVAEAAPEPTPVKGRAYTSAAQGFWIQLGAFKQREGAEQFQRRVSDEVDWLGPQLALFSEPSLFRLQAGPYTSRPEAQAAAERIRGMIQLVPVIIEKR
ncbi:MAG: hypothetical protein RLZZ618_256 [Pseudomonadota bacterium]|jgi:rare lipoprotein A